MKKARRILALLLCVLLAAGQFPAAAERESWKCPRCGHTGNRTDFCGACEWQAPPEGEDREWDLWTCPGCGAEWNWGRFCAKCGRPKPEPTAEPTTAPAEAPAWMLLYTVYYRDEAGALLNSVPLTLNGRGTVTCMIYSDDGMVPSGYVLTGEDCAAVTVENGRAEPSMVTFVYRNTRTPAVALSPAPSPAPTAEPTAAPTAEPTVEPSSTPTLAPTPAPKPTPRVKAGEYVSFGRFEQDNSPSNGQEPIQWLVLEVDEDRGRAFLLSRYGLSAMAYNSAYKKVTWETCGLRAWLNGAFLDAAFTAREQEAIVLTTVDNGAAEGYGGYETEGGNSTRDRVFLLSYGEANRYLGAAHYSVTGSKNNMTARTSATAYAKAQGAADSSRYKTAEGEAACWWWLRSPGISSSSAAYVYYTGACNSNHVNGTYAAIRPALWVDLDAAPF